MLWSKKIFCVSCNTSWTSRYVVLSSVAILWRSWGKSPRHYVYNIWSEDCRVFSENFYRFLRVQICSKTPLDLLAPCVRRHASWLLPHHRLGIASSKWPFLFFTVISEKALCKHGLTLLCKYRSILSRNLGISRYEWGHYRQIFVFHLGCQSTVAM